ncbi:hypothetical protein K474DRAFT_1683062 [Panus rudis PR-1116 ss-1]|nr:hypothetical protein K474DRAFT_1683062 [Panus rudis PR-1116 ss-1]
MFRVFASPDNIDYLPEKALEEGLSMVKAIRASITKLELGSKLRKDVWLREIESLQSQGVPTTMIAVCGATGAGKSSILNAILDDNIVPTSGMRACTAVVTEIAYHTKKSIDADVSFLSEKEWRDELAVLLDDLVDEDGNVKRSTDLRSDAGVAWQKVHAVYPKVTQEALVRMSVDQILALDARVSSILGTTKHISTNDSKSFAKEIGKYIDSKDQKRGDKKKAKAKEITKEKDKPKGLSLLEKFKQKNARNTNKKDDDYDPEGPAFWPLIRQVNVRCNARALSTGAILVDLPGVADANAARNNIAKDYMKKCDCVWILAPITRAVDDKTARDLMGDAFKMQLMMGKCYDAHAITFIATKCDDISCSEVIRALNLDDDPELEKIEEEIENCRAETTEWKEKKAEADQAIKAIDKELKEIRPMLQEYKEHLKALEKGETFTPTLTAKRKKVNAGEKRRRGSDDEGAPFKRRRTADSDYSDDDDFIVDDDDDLDVELELAGSEDDNKQSEADSSDGEKPSDDKDSDKGADDEHTDDEEEEVSQETLRTNIAEAEDAIKEGRAQLNELRNVRKEAIDKLANLKKRESKAQREKNAFCSLKRSEFSRDVLKEDFRVGLKDLDDAAAEQRDPNNFDPTVNIRDYDAIDLPVFTVSSRDYVRIKGQVKGDGDPTCFTEVKDTGIPALQEWCHTLTISSRERAARNFLTHLKTFANSIRTYVQGIGDVTIADRESLRAKWESTLPEDDYDDLYDQMPGSDFEAAANFAGLNLHGLTAQLVQNNQPLFKMVEPKVDQNGEAVGITARLIKDFHHVVQDCVRELQTRFRDGLEEKCQTGAANASAAAVQTSDTFAASMHWATYRATLRRHGTWRHDLNVELSNPFTRNIASSWSKVFEADLFAGFERATTDCIRQLLKEVEDSAAPGLKERARGQAELSLEEAKVALRKTIDLVRDTINTEQKEISRCLSPHVQNQLVEGYDRAMEERGKGSVARQKALFHNYVDDLKEEIFEGAADVIMTRLTKAAEAVGDALEEALAELAEKVEVSVAVLWEGTRDNPAQVRAREEVIDTMNEIIKQVTLWQEAAQKKKESVDASHADGDIELNG